MVTGSKLTLSLSKVERSTVSLGVTSYEENEERDDCRNVAFEDKPSERTCLCLNDAAYLHCACEHNGCDKT